MIIPSPRATGRGLGPNAKQWEGEGPPSETDLNPLLHRVKITHQLLIAKADDTVEASPVGVLKSAQV